MTTRLQEEIKYCNRDEPIGHNLTNNFLHNRNLQLPSSEIKELDMWASGGEHLSTTKLGLMLNSMQGRLKDLPANESHEDERLWSLRSVSGDSLDVSEMDSGLFSQLQRDSESPHVFGYMESMTGSPGPNTELRSIPRSGSYSRQGDDDNDSLSSVSTTSSASMLHRGRRAKLASAAHLSTTSPNTSKMHRKPQHRLKSDPEYDYISDGASVTSVESRGASQRMRPAADLSAQPAQLPAAATSTNLATLESIERAISPPKPGSPKQASESIPMAVEPKRRYNPFTEALQSQGAGRSSRAASSQRARPTQIESKASGESSPTPVAGSSSAQVLSLMTPGSPELSSSGDIPRPRPRTPTGIPRAVSSGASSPPGRHSGNEVSKATSSTNESIPFPLRHLMGDRSKSPRAGVPDPPSSPPNTLLLAQEPQPSSEVVSELVTSPPGSDEKDATRSRRPQRGPSAPRLTASRLALNPVVAELLATKKVPLAASMEAAPVPEISVPAPVPEVSLPAPTPASEPSQYPERGRLRLRSTSNPRSSSVPAVSSVVSVPLATPASASDRNVRSTSRGASATRTAGGTARPTQEAAVVAIKWQKPIGSSRSANNAPPVREAKVRSSFGSSVSAPAPLHAKLPSSVVVKSPPPRTAPSSTSSRPSSTASQPRAKSPATAPNRAKSPVAAPRAKSPAATARPSNRTAGGAHATMAVAPAAGPTWAGNTRTPTKVNTHVVPLSLSASRLSTNGSSMSSISTSGSRSPTPTSTATSRQSQVADSNGSSVLLKSTNPYPLRKTGSPRSPGAATSTAFFSPPVKPVAATITPKNRRASDGGTPLSAGRPYSNSKIAAPSPAAHLQRKTEFSPKPRSSFPGGMNRTSAPTTPSNSSSAMNNGDGADLAKSLRIWSPPPEAVLFTASSAPQRFMLPMAHLGQESISGVYDSHNYNPSPAHFLRSPKAAFKYSQRAAEAQRDREKQQQQYWRSAASSTSGTIEDNTDPGSGRTETTNATNISGNTDFLPTEGLFAIGEDGSLSESENPETDEM